MKTFRRPILSPSQPKKIPPGIAAMPEANKIVPDCPKVRCQSFDKKCQDKAYQSKIKKIYYYRKQASSEDLPLVDGKRCLPLEQLQHDFLLFKYCLYSRRPTLSGWLGFADWANKYCDVRAPSKGDAARYCLSLKREGGTDLPGCLAA